MVSRRLGGVAAAGRLLGGVVAAAGRLVTAVLVRAAG